MTIMSSAEDNKIIAGFVREGITDEWLAHFQYWIGSVIVEESREDVIQQFVEHSSDEYDHATDLASWLRNFPRDAHLPYAMSELTHPYCGYVYPTGITAAALLHDNIQGEKCAVKFYTHFLAELSDRRYSGTDLGGLLEEILAKEKEHLRDLEKLI